jgi:hypothetical protein
MARSFQIVKDTVTPRLENISKLYGARTRALIEGWLDEDVIPEARRRAPKDTEQLADSLRVYVGPGEPPTSGGVRSGSRKLMYVHGRHATPAPPRRRSSPHFPPATQSLKGWAARHGIPVFLVQRSIAEKGTPIVPFVSEAVDAKIGKLKSRINKLARDIEKDWQ